MKVHVLVASDSNMIPVWLLIFVFFRVSLASVERRVPQYQGKIIRSRREVCVDGTYLYDNRNCCRCSAGQWVKEHCTVNQAYGKCELCDSGTYNSEPNGKTKCDPCTSCAHPNANLEVQDFCTAASDTKCRCKKDHYCIDETCKLCSPCTVCDAEGIKARCTDTSNTVCNDQREEGNKSNLIPAIVIPILIIIVGIIVFVLWRKKKRMTQHIIQQTNGSPPEVEMQPLRVSGDDLLPLLPDIAEKLGWKDMKAVAIRSGIGNATIESCQLNHPNDAQEQTLELLTMWVEKKGREAPRDLIQILEESGKKGKAEAVERILSRGSTARSV